MQTEGDPEGKRGKKTRDRKGGEGRDKEAKRSGERKERGQDGSGSTAGVISEGTCLCGTVIIYIDCRSVVLCGWRVRLTEIRKEEKRVKVLDQMQGKAHRSVGNAPYLFSAPTKTTPSCNWSSYTRSPSNADEKRSKQR